MSALAGRLYQLQVLDTERFSTLAEENRISLRLLAPPRGLIFDRIGQPLAVNRNNFRAMVTSDRGRGAEIVIDRLDQILSIGDTEKARLLRELRRSRNFQPSWCERISAGKRSRGSSSTRPTCRACSSISARRETIPKAS